MSALSVWRVLQDGAGGAAWNMAADESLLDAVATNEAPPTLRLYRWERPAVTLGRFQNIERTVDVTACETQGIPLVRRITGGRGILHGDDLTISIAAPMEALGLTGERTTIAIYERLAEGFLRAFAKLGVDAVAGSVEGEGAGKRKKEKEERESPTTQLPNSQHPTPNAYVCGDCFAVTSRADIVDRTSGRKILGTALHRRDRWILQQTSLPLLSLLAEEEQKAWEARCRAVFRGEQAEFAAVALARPEVSVIIEAMIRSFAATLGVEMKIGDWTLWERLEAERLVSARYADAAWTQRR